MGRGLETHLVKAAAACTKRGVPCAAGKGWDARFWQLRNVAAAGSRKVASQGPGNKEPESGWGWGGGGQHQGKVSPVKAELLSAVLPGSEETANLPPSCGSYHWSIFKNT